MALIIMCCHDTEENGRTEYTKKTLESLCLTVNWRKHRIIIIDNNSCKETKDELRFVNNMGWVITNDENIGTARAVNMGIKLRTPGENVIKLDNDIHIHQSGWVEQMEEAIERDPTIGIVGLKRKDLCQTPWHESPDFRSELVMLPHEPGQRWIIVEVSKDIMGTCTMLSSSLLDRLGFYCSPGVYGLDDTLMNLRSLLAGFKNVFLPHIELEHLDRGGTDYTEQKRQWAAAAWPVYHEWHKAYIDGTRDLYYNGE